MPQLGYSSTFENWECVECPEGKTCDRNGVASCDGQCGPGIRSECDAALGYARCEAGCNASLSPHMAPQWRGTYQSPAQGECTTYIRCNAGFFKRFTTDGKLSCQPCLGIPTLASPLSAGLTPNDPASCLWECEYGLQQRVVWTGTTCSGAGDRGDVPKHKPGWYGGLRAPEQTCGGGEFTTQANTTLDAGGCMACPRRPANSIAVPGGVQCEWVCPPGFVARGARCVRAWRVGEPCDDAGVGKDAASGACVQSAVPWNAAGTRKVAPRVVVDPNGPTQGTWVTSPALQPYIIQDSLVKRHAVQYNGEVYPVIRPICSMVAARLGGRNYMLGAVCGQAFLAYVELPPGGRVWNMYPVRVLIGQPAKPGWADGFRTQAQFQTELYVAKGTDDTSLWVLDRWNCVVREVTVWDTPGDYRTRVYTVHGLTDRFALRVQPGPKCYGPGSLAGPRRFWDVGGGVLVFTDDHGLWQLHVATGELASVMGEGWAVGRVFEADSLVAVALAGKAVMYLGFSGGATWTVRASVEPCPDDTTSMAGGDCAVQCGWPGSFVDPATGLCVPCGVSACGVGYELVGCTRGRQAWCRACETPAQTVGNYTRVFVVAGTCDERRMRYKAPPCPVGMYAKESGGWCEACPTSASGIAPKTMTASATRVEQCKCLAWQGLRRAADGACVGEALYVYPGEAARGCGLCNVPPNATLVDGHGYGRCQWECDAGFYRNLDMTTGWGERCKRCTRVGYYDESRRPATRGDDGAPLSCEFV